MTRRAGAPGLERAELPVVGYQRWHDILFVHWEVPSEVMRPLVDGRLELDLRGGRAYLSATPFTMRGARLRYLPPLPTLAGFHELNLRTYVRAEGAPGLWFLSLDAASAAAAAIARLSLGLPYFRARIERRASGAAHEYRCERLAPGPRPAIFDARWRVGGRSAAPPRSITRFLSERYALYTVLRGRLLRVRVRHRRWVLHDVALERLDETITRAAGIEVPPAPALAHFSPGVDVEVLAPELVARDLAENLDGVAARRHTVAP